MTMKSNLLAIVSALLAGCATAPPSPQELDQFTQGIIKSSFREQGIAKLDRLTQDETQAACSQYAGKELPKDVAAKIEQAKS